MRTERTILKKINEWGSNPLIVPAVYRLITYLRWEAIPDKYKEFFSKEAAETWNDDIHTFKEANILLDIDAEIKAAFKGLFKKNIFQVLSIIPIILADVFILGRPTAKAQATLIKITNSYTKHRDTDLKLAEAFAIYELTEFLGYLQDLAKLENKLDLKKLLNDIVDSNNFQKLIDYETTTITDDINKSIDAALLEYDQAKQKAGNNDK